MTIAFRFGDQTELAESQRSRLDNIYYNYFESCSAGSYEKSQIALTRYICNMSLNNSLCASLFVAFACILIYYVTRLSKFALLKLATLINQFSLTIIILTMLAWKEFVAFCTTPPQQQPLSDSEASSLSASSLRNDQSSNANNSALNQNNLTRQEAENDFDLNGTSLTLNSPKYKINLYVRNKEGPEHNWLKWVKVEFVEENVQAIISPKPSLVVMKDEAHFYQDYLEVDRTQPGVALCFKKI